MSDVYVNIVSDVDRKDLMQEKEKKGRIFDEIMETRVTVRLDKKHIKTIDNIIKKNNLKNKSDAIRFVIEQFEKTK